MNLYKLAARLETAEQEEAARLYQVAAEIVLELQYEDGSGRGRQLVDDLLTATDGLPDDVRSRLLAVVLRVVAWDDGELDKAAYDRHMICAAVARKSQELPGPLRLAVIEDVIRTAGGLYAQHGFEDTKDIGMIVDEALALPDDLDLSSVLRLARRLVTWPDPEYRRWRTDTLARIRARAAQHRGLH